MTETTQYEKVAPPRMVDVPYKGLWLGGELEAWMGFDDEPRRGLVKFYLPGGGSQYWWFDQASILPRGFAERASAATTPPAAPAGTA